MVFFPRESAHDDILTDLPWKKKEIEKKKENIKKTVMRDLQYFPRFSESRYKLKNRFLEYLIF